MQKSIKLEKLKLAENNVRKQRSQAADEQLSKDIEARGLLQNLIVTKAKKRGFYDVIAGGRRLRAMEMLVESGSWEKTREIPCMVLEADDAVVTETSLAENFQRMAMSPTDECRAFKHFIGEDGDIEAVANRFGVTVRFVEGRLRLADLAEPIFDALSRGDITLDVAKAYASSPRHDLQLLVYEQLDGRWDGHNVNAIKRMMANECLTGDNPVVKLIGEERYKKAGGRIERDLFSDEAGDRWIDLEIIRDLADSIMREEAENIAKDSKLGWITPIPTSHTPYSVIHENGLHGVHLPPKPLDDETVQQRENLQQQIEQLEEYVDANDLGEDELATVQEKYENLVAEHEALGESEYIFPEEYADQIGQFLLLNDDGQMVLDNNYYADKPLTFTCDDEGNISVYDRSGKKPSDSSSDEKREVTDERKGPGGKAISQTLFSELAIQRRNILSAALLGDPVLALDYAIFAMIDDSQTIDKGCAIAISDVKDPYGVEIPEGKAETAIAQFHDTLDDSWKAHDDVAMRFNVFRQLDDEKKLQWLSQAVAGSLIAKNSYGNRYYQIHDDIAESLQIDVASIWRPTAPNYFDRITKKALLALLHDIGGAELSVRYASMKKAEIAKACEQIFSGDAIIETDVREKALHWVPAAMRFGSDAHCDDLDCDEDDANATDSDDSDNNDDNDDLIVDDEEAVLEETA